MEHIEWKTCKAFDDFSNKAQQANPPVKIWNRSIDALHGGTKPNCPAFPTGNYDSEEVLTPDEYTWYCPICYRHRLGDVKPENEG